MTGLERMLHSAAMLLTLLIVLAPTNAHAGDAAAAEALFKEGRELMQQQRYDLACPKLAESQRLDPGAGTALNLADCYEHWGKTATAWATWLEAAAIAKRTGQTARVELADGKAKALEGKLSRLIVDVPAESRVPGLHITRGQDEVGESSWGTALPVDPGVYTLRAEAPRFAPFEVQVNVAPNGAVAHVVIPHLEALAATPAQPAAPAPQPAASGTPAAPPSPAAQSLPAGPAPPGEARPVTNDRRTYGIVLSAVGAVGLGIGTAFSLRARSKNEDSKGHCGDNPNLCSPEGVALRNDAISAGNTATVLMGLGAAAATVGVVLWVTAADDSEPAAAAKLALSPSTTGRGGSLTLEGGF